MTNSSRPIIVWCGQLTGDDGYGAAARAHVKGLKRMNVPHVAIDTRTLKTFGTYDQASVAIEQKGKLLTIRTVVPSTLTNTATAKDVQDQFGTGSKSSDLESTAHGSSNIFDASGVGRDPTVNDMKRMLIFMRKGVERYGGRLRNATIGGELDVLERLDLETLFD